MGTSEKGGSKGHRCAWSWVAGTGHWGMGGGELDSRAMGPKSCKSWNHDLQRLGFSLVSIIAYIGYSGLNCVPPNI